MRQVKKDGYQRAERKGIPGRKRSKNKSKTSREKQGVGHISSKGWAHNLARWEIAIHGHV